MEMKTLNKHFHGFTLIELLVVITIMAILYTGASIVPSWLNRSVINKATTEFQQGYAMSKSLAQRNPCGEGSQLVVKNINARIQIESQARTSGSCAFLTDFPNPQWIYVLPPRVSIEWNETPLLEGQTQTLSISSLGIADEHVQIKVKKGNHDENTFHF